MKQKRRNLVEGRLGIPSLTPRRSTPRDDREVEYGLERLGIASSQAEMPPPPKQRAKAEPPPPKQPAEAEAPPPEQRDEAEPPPSNQWIKLEPPPPKQQAKLEPPPPPKPVARPDPRGHAQAAALLREMAASAAAEEQQQSELASSRLDLARRLLGRYGRRKLQVVGVAAAAVLALALVVRYAVSDRSPRAARAADSALASPSATVAHSDEPPAEPPKLPKPPLPAPIETAMGPVTPPTGQQPGVKPAPSGAPEQPRRTVRQVPEIPAWAVAPAPAPPSQPAAPPPESRTVAFGVAPPGIVLSCIMRGPKGCIAIINNRAVKVGHMVEDATVVRIDQFSVELERKGRRFLLGIATPRGTSSQETPPAEAEPEETPAAGQTTKLESPKE